MTYSTYKEYTESFIPWLSKIPNYWIVDRLKWSITGCQNGIWGEEPNGNSAIICIRVADFDRVKLIVNEDNFTLRYIPENDKIKKLLKKNDLLLEKSGGGEKQLVGAVIQVNKQFDAVNSNFIARMQVTDGFDSRYLTYLHYHLYNSKVNFRSLKQTTGIQNLDSQQYLNEIVAYPPLQEQQSIASFLDYKTKQIDDLIAKNERLLKFLDEKRIALITNAVTKGLNPNVKMKPIVIEWLGDIPEHWEVKRLKFVANCNQYVLSEDTDDQYLLDYIDISSVDRIKGIIKKEPLLFYEAPSRARRKVKKGDTIISTVRTYLKAIAQINDEQDNLIVSTGFAVISPSQQITSDYLSFYLQNEFFINSVVANSLGVSYPAINSSDLMNIIILLPPVKEQNEITEYLKKEILHINSLSLKIQKAIDILKEYRTSLITSAVTGKILVAT